MSTRRTEYVMVGAPVDPKVISSLPDEEYEEHVDGLGLDQPGILYDGMSGEYAIAGVLLTHPAYDDGEGIPLTVIDLSDGMLESRVTLAKNYASSLGFDIEPKIVVVSHWG